MDIYWIRKKALIIDLTQAPREIKEEIQNILNESPKDGSLNFSEETNKMIEKEINKYIDGSLK